MTSFDMIPVFKFQVKLRNEIDRNNEIIYYTFALVRNKCNLIILVTSVISIQRSAMKSCTKVYKIFPNSFVILSPDWFEILSWDCLLPPPPTLHLSTSLLVSSTERLQSPICAFQSQMYEVSPLSHRLRRKSSR